MPHNIRKVATSDDFRQFHAVVSEYEASLPEDLRHGIVGDIASVVQAYAEPNAAFLATGNDLVGGCVALTRFDPITAMVVRLYVKPAARGQGVARLLVNAVLDFARGHGYARVVLDTDKERLAAAYRLYESLGFKECAPYGPVDYDNPTYMELIL
jgi:putative acetyltransferase